MAVFTVAAKKENQLRIGVFIITGNDTFFVYIEALYCHHSHIGSSTGRFTHYGGSFTNKQFYSCPIVEQAVEKELVILPNIIKQRVAIELSIKRSRSRSSFCRLCRENYTVQTRGGIIGFKDIKLARKSREIGRMSIFCTRQEYTFTPRINIYSTVSGNINIGITRHIGITRGIKIPRRTVGNVDIGTESSIVAAHTT